MAEQGKAIYNRAKKATCAWIQERMGLTIVSFCSEIIPLIFPYTHFFFFFSLLTYSLYKGGGLGGQNKGLYTTIINLHRPPGALGRHCGPLTPSLLRTLKGLSMAPLNPGRVLRKFCHSTQAWDFLEELYVLLSGRYFCKVKVRCIENEPDFGFPSI